MSETPEAAIRGFPLVARSSPGHPAAVTIGCVVEQGLTGGMTDPARWDDPRSLG